MIGAKLGLTSRVKRQALGIHEPVFGRLTSGMVVPHGQALQLDELIHPRAEPEIAFLIGKRIEAPTTVAQVLAATEAVFPAIEVVDSRYSEPFRLPDSVADNAGAARIVVGARGRPPEALVDLSVLGCVFRCRGAIDTAAGGAVMGHPAAALVWLAEALAAREECVEPGSIVLVGRSDGLGAAAVPRGRDRGVRRPRVDRRALRMSEEEATTAEVTILPDGVRVVAREGETLLRALARAGLRYRVGCRRGGCGICKVQLKLGEVRYERPIADSVLSDDERVEGICLSCRAVPITNIVIELQEGDRLRRVLGFVYPNSAPNSASNSARSPARPPAAPVAEHHGKEENR